MPKESFFEFPDFKDLNASTVTTVVYSNISLNEKKLFEQIHTIPTDAGAILLSKKSRKDFCKNRPKNQVISVQYQDRIKGCVIRKPKKYWCNVCQIVEKSSKDARVDSDYVKVNTVIENYIYDSELDIIKINCYCSNCKKTYNPQDLKILSYFRNQVMVYITTERNLANLMIFDGAIKIAGSSSVKESRQIIANFWSQKIQPTSCWKSPPDSPIKFVFREGMINMNFKFGTFLNSENFGKLWDSLKKKDHVADVINGEGGQKSVNIKFHKIFSGRKSLLYFDKPDSKIAKLTYCDGWPEGVRHNKKKKNGKKKFNSVVVFMTTSTVITGKDCADLEYCFNYFKQKVLENESCLKEFIKPLDLNALDKVLAAPLI
jgi:hypothetical protein